MITNYIRNLRNSKTIRAAFVKKVVGAMIVILANLNYFEGLVTPTTFATITGVLTILVGLYDHYTRTQTTQALGDK